MKWLLMLLAVIFWFEFSICTPAFADGQIALYGVGASSCGSLLDAWEASDPSVGLQQDGKVYLPQSAIYQAWIAGFISTYNMLDNMSDKSHGDIANGSDIQGIDLWIRNYCTKNPTQLVSRAAWAFIMNRQHQKSKNDSK